MKSGKLGVGYGADNIKIVVRNTWIWPASHGSKIKGPILLIREASWGRVSLCVIFARHRRPTLRIHETTCRCEAKAENLVKFRGGS
ncbi:MAG: hypothetical protein CM15mP130_2780 [Verrucomicrobiota bacterium]|nr:MAG: hypothetical protein CM15mP130_2780 [Verrucomicrobiota bacterium]